MNVVIGLVYHAGRAEVNVGATGAEAPGPYLDIGPYLPTVIDLPGQSRFLVLCPVIHMSRDLSRKQGTESCSFLTLPQNASVENRLHYTPTAHS